ncbi:hypothetical protein VT84_14080 [Gemmata sp. SH-PL17]|uniref:DUF2236 domain-containing protein n=1 Tax=Gemmata sp. SH-PL17 TaxID=1630693 RepID=UPI00078D179E|nr:DUF2236 domain-containing protein [Gemmata sp. SH-PL17]AMV25522.1 hypothetical protein VT84_14080 [Gemmata sp. SH-PL17]
MANFIEIVGNGEGGMQTAISQEEGSATAIYRLLGADEDTPPTVAEVAQFFDTMIGGVLNLEPKVVNTATAGAGKIIRVLPPVHPFRPELSAAAVDNMVGIGNQTNGASVSIFGLPPVTAQFPHYTAYDYRVKFTKRPYFLLPDSKVAVKSATYYDANGASSSIVYAEEWTRFCTTTRAPSNDFANATFGQLTFRTDSGTDPDNRQYNNSVYVNLQNSHIDINWFQVPYRYFLDFEGLKSYLTRFVGTVNQRDWNGFPAGSLLYLGATPTSIYIPASPKKNTVLWGALATGIDDSLMCNVRLSFLHTARQGTDVPTSAHALLTNKNNIAAGHNLQANFKDRRFYYVVGDGGTDATRNATYQSFPFELLFTDPHLEQPGGNP